MSLHFVRRCGQGASRETWKRERRRRTKPKTAPPDANTSLSAPSSFSSSLDCLLDFRNFSLPLKPSSTSSSVGCLPSAIRHLSSSSSSFFSSSSCSPSCPVQFSSPYPFSQSAEPRERCSPALSCRPPPLSSFHTQRGERRRRIRLSSSSPPPPLPLSFLADISTSPTSAPLEVSSVTFRENNVKRKRDEIFLFSDRRRLDHTPHEVPQPSCSSRGFSRRPSSSFSFSSPSGSYYSPSLSSFSSRVFSSSRSFPSSFSSFLSLSSACIFSRVGEALRSFPLSPRTSSRLSSPYFPCSRLSFRFSCHLFCQRGPHGQRHSSLPSSSSSFLEPRMKKDICPLLHSPRRHHANCFFSSRNFHRVSSCSFSSASDPRAPREEVEEEEEEIEKSLPTCRDFGGTGRRRKLSRETSSHTDGTNVEEEDADEGFEGRGVHTLAVTREQFHDGSRGLFRPHPFNRRFSRVRKPVFPIEARNLRLMYKRKSKRRRGRGDKSNAKGIRWKHVHQQAGRYKGPRSRTFEGGKTPLYKRIPKWPEAWLGRQRKTLEPLNLAKLRTFIEKGRLDARYPITQRHLHDSRCVKVKNGVRLFNVNDYPFPYRISIEVSGADQSSIDAIRRVGGEVVIVYRNRLNLRAHVKPYKFEVLPRTARPNLEMLHYLEKMRARGCVVKYIKPLWLIEEEKILKTQLAEFEAEASIARGEGVDKRPETIRESIDDLQDRLLKQYRLRETLAADLEEDQAQQQNRQKEEETQKV